MADNGVLDGVRLAVRARAARSTRRKATALALAVAVAAFLGMLALREAVREAAAPRGPYAYRLEYSPEGVPGEHAPAIRAALEREIAALGRFDAAGEPIRVALRVTLERVKLSGAHAIVNVTLEWVVRDRSRKLGIVTQRNWISAKQVDRLWAEIEARAVKAAAPGIVRLAEGR
jgi:hypothetical protein